MGSSGSVFKRKVQAVQVVQAFEGTKKRGLEKNEKVLKDIRPENMDTKKGTPRSKMYETFTGNTKGAKSEVVRKERKESVISLSNGNSLTVTDTSSAWDELRRGEMPECDQLPKIKLSGRPTQGKGSKEEDGPLFNIPYNMEEKLQTSNICSVCQDRDDDELVSCRICYQSFHKACLMKSSRYHDTVQVAMLDRARTPTGWSCHTCDDLSKLLTDEELSSLVETFDKYDVNRDASISLEEFINYKERRRKDFQIDSSGMTKDEIGDEKFKFAKMDKDNTGLISWWEFLNYECVMILQKRPKSSLVNLLSLREIELARKVFHAFDTDGDGEITEREARVALVSWYTLFLKPRDTFNGYAIFSEDNDRQLQHHLQQNIGLMMEADEDKSGTISWEEYLKDQAIYFLSSRPNESNIPVGNKGFLEGISRTVGHKHFEKTS